MKTLFLAGTAFLAAALLTGCGGSSSSSTDDGGNTPASQETTLKIPFTAVAGETEISCGTPVSGLGSSDSSGQFQYAAWFVYDVKLVTEAGDVETQMVENDFQNADYDFAFLEFRDILGGCTHADQEPYPTNNMLTLTANVDASQVKGIKFKLGMPYEPNHTVENKFQQEKAYYAMLWNWQAGFRFMRVDLIPNGGFTQGGTLYEDKTYNFHLGSTGCEGDPVVCAQPNNTTDFVLTNDQFVVNESGTGTKVKFDYAELVSGMDLTVDEGGSKGCMSALQDPECTPMFYNLGIPLGDKVGRTDQQVFSLQLN